MDKESNQTKQSNSKVVKRILDFAYYFIILLLIVVLMYTVINKNNGNIKSLKIFGYTPTIVMSGSMEPTLKVYSINIIKQCDIQDVKEKDIIVFRNEVRGINVIHRAFEINTNESGEIEILVVTSSRKSGLKMFK